MRVYRPIISPQVAERIRHLPPDLKRGVREAIRAIGLEPGCGEPLKRELQDYLKYRVRRFHIVYRVDRAAKTVAIVAVGYGRAIYEEVAATIRPRSRREPQPG